MCDSYHGYFNFIKGKNIAVLGIGISNTPLIKLLLSKGAIVTACDKKSRTELGEIVKELHEAGVILKLGAGYLSNLKADIIFKTPGMRYDLAELAQARENGSIITSEMEVFFDLCPAKIIAVTGSDGKTTTTTLIYEILKQSGLVCHLGGNIGKPLLSEIENIKSEDLCVLELSSFQLQTMRKSPHIAVVTNITPNHLDMHKSMQEYIDAKKNIFLFQNENDKLILNFDNELTRNFQIDAKSNIQYFSSKQQVDRGVYVEGNNIVIEEGSKKLNVIRTDDIVIPGVHNVENYMAAIAAVWDYADRSSIKHIANTFKGVPHRCEFVKEIEGVRYYNSSIDSSPNRTKATLNVFDQKVILIAGGKDKNIPYDDLGHTIATKVKKLILIGATSEKIENALLQEIEKTGIGKDIEILHCTNYDEVVKTACKVSIEGDIVVLSPASTSFDMFKNFEERGNLFKKLINNL